MVRLGTDFVVGLFFCSVIWRGRALYIEEGMVDFGGEVGGVPT